MRCRKITAPFFILSTERSRSAWAAAYLTTTVSWCGHDVCGRQGRFDPPPGYDFAGAIGSDVTACINGLVAEFPRARFAAVVRRPETTVRSLRRLGLPASIKLARHLHSKILAFADGRDCPVFDFDAWDVTRMRRLWEHCLPGPCWCSHRAAMFAGFNVQLDSIQFQGRRL